MPLKAKVPALCVDASTIIRTNVLKWTANTPTRQPVFTLAHSLLVKETGSKSFIPTTKRNISGNLPDSKEAPHKKQFGAKKNWKGIDRERERDREIEKERRSERERNRQRERDSERERVGQQQ